ncbi:MAG TPA: serine hydrolase [Micropepsaceae bacterium]|nr:serine hydrolase [Micropepsaceae bacterium]
MTSIRIPFRALTVALVACFAVPKQSVSQTAACGTPLAADDGWKLATPESVGFDPRSLCQWTEHRIATPRENIHAVVVARHGAIVFERYFTGDDERLGRPLGQVAYDRTMAHDMRSISKSVTSLLVGIALDQKKIASLDQPVFDFFPEYGDLRTPEKERIKLRDLLTMSAGFAWDETLTPYTDPNNSEIRMNRAVDPYRYIFSQSIVAVPGAKYNYSGGSAALLGAIIRKTTGQTIDDFARAVLFGPLGITDFEWVKLPNGDPVADAGLRLKPRDLAKIGQLVLAHGIWNGRQVVPRTYVDESTAPQIQGAGTFFYGYQWWLGRSLVGAREVDWAAGVGLGGQRVVVVPSLDLIVVMTAGLYTSPLQGSLTIDVLNDYVLSGIHGN